MNQTLKYTTMALVLVVFSLIGYLLVRQSFRGGAVGPLPDDQMMAACRQMRQSQHQAYLKYLEKAEEQLEMTRSINERMLRNQKRYENLLDRWEDQADRIDAMMAKPGRRR